MLKPLMSSSVLFCNLVIYKLRFGLSGVNNDVVLFFLSGTFSVLMELTLRCEKSLKILCWSF
jgi:hypothetical protein